MEHNQLIDKLVFIGLNVKKGKFVWDGVYHGENDPVGPIHGGGLERDISNGF